MSREFHVLAWPARAVVGPRGPMCARFAGGRLTGTALHAQRAVSVSRLDPTVLRMQVQEGAQCYCVPPPTHPLAPAPPPSTDLALGGKLSCKEAVEPFSGHHDMGSTCRPTRLLHCPRRYSA